MSSETIVDFVKIEYLTSNIQHAFNVVSFL